MAAVAPVIRIPWSVAAFHGYRALWWGALFFVVLINLVAAPQAEWIDRAKAAAGVRLGLAFPDYPSPAPDGDGFRPFGAIGKTLNMQGYETLLAVNGRPLPSNDKGRIAGMSGPDGALVTLTLRRHAEPRIRRK